MKGCASSFRSLDCSFLKPSLRVSESLSQTPGLSSIDLLLFSSSSLCIINGGMMGFTANGHISECVCVFKCVWTCTRAPLPASHADENKKARLRRKGLWCQQQHQCWLAGCQEAAATGQPSVWKQLYANALSQKPVLTFKKHSGEQKQQTVLTSCRHNESTDCTLEWITQRQVRVMKNSYENGRKLWKHFPCWHEQKPQPWQEQRKIPKIKQTWLNLNLLEIFVIFIESVFSQVWQEHWLWQDTHRAVVLLLQQGGDVSSDGHLLGQILILQTDPPPQLLQETQQTRPALGARLQMGSAKAHTSVGPMIGWLKCTKAT